MKTKFMPYVAVNRMYFSDGHTRILLTAYGENPTALKRKVIRDNAWWNKKVGKKDGVKVVLMEIRKRKRPKPRSQSGIIYVPLSVKRPSFRYL